MQGRWKFLARFLARKQIKLSEILASRRTRSFTKKETTGSSKFVKFRDKTFQLFECSDGDEVIGEVLDEQVFPAGVKQGGSDNSVGRCTRMIIIFLQSVSEEGSRRKKIHPVETIEPLHNVSWVEVIPTHMSSEELSSLWGRT